jgi:peptidoglycan/LPS O-acetylase OafA/YrhL
MTACVLGALALHYLVERPFMQLRDRVLRRAPRREAALDDSADLPALTD